MKARTAAAGEDKRWRWTTRVPGWRGELGRRQGKKPSAIQVSEKKINEGIETAGEKSRGDIFESGFLAIAIEGTIIATVDLIQKCDKFTRESKLHYNSRTYCHGFDLANTVKSNEFAPVIYIQSFGSERDATGTN